MKSILKIMMVSLVLISGLHLKAQDASKTLLQTEKMAKALGLDAKQKAELDKELKTNIQERKEKTERMRALRAEMKRDAFLDRQAKVEKLKSILTPEQLIKYETLKAQKSSKGRMQGQRNFRGQRGQEDNNRPMMKKRLMLEKKKRQLRENEGKGDRGND
jgi:hypothetical protein